MYTVAPSSIIQSMDSKFSARSGLADAFTLVELITTVAVVGILSAILLSGTGMIRGKARQAESAAKLKAIGTACVAFASDNGYLPSMTAHYPHMINTYGGDTFNHYARQLGDTTQSGGNGPTIWTDLVPYMGGDAKVCFMKADKNAPNSGSSSTWQNSTNMWVDASFTYRWCVLQYEANIAKRPLRMTDFSFPSKQILFHEYSDWSSAKPTPFYEPPSAKPFNALYADGHVQMLPKITPAPLNFFNASQPGAESPEKNLQAAWDEY